MRLRSQVFLLSTFLLASAASLGQAPDTSQSHIFTAHSPAAVRSAFARSVCSSPSTIGNISGCTVVLGHDFPYAEESTRWTGLGNPPPFFTGIAQRVIDRRGGGEHFIVMDAVPTGGREPACPLCLDVYEHTKPSAADALQLNLSSSYPGYSRGNYGGRYEGWTTVKALNVSHIAYGAGISQGIGLSMQKNGIGDVANYLYVFGQGGFRSSSDEMLEGFAVNAGEMPGPAFSATVASIHGDFITTKDPVAPGTQGVGRMMANLSHPVVENGCASDMRQFTYQNVAYGASIITLACGAKIPQEDIATGWGVLDPLPGKTHPIDVPALPSAGPGSRITTPATVSVHMLHGVVKQGDHACFSGHFREDALVAHVEAGRGEHGDDLVTFDVRRPHMPGLIFFSSVGCMGLEFKAEDWIDKNGYGPDARGKGTGLRYLQDVLGAIDSTHFIAVFMSGNQNSIPAQHYKTYFAKAPFEAAPMMRHHGVVTFYAGGGSGHDPLYQNTTVTFSGLSDPSFNTVCTHVAPIDGDELTCKQRGPDATLQDASSGYMTIGTTGYGNTELNLFPVAEVLDVNDYSKGFASNPRAGTFRLEPNGMHLHIGDIVEEVHDYAAGYLGLHLNLNWFNPYASQYSQIMDVGMCCAADSSNYQMNVHNATPVASYKGFGGTLDPPRGYNTPGYPWAYQNHMEYMPWPSNSAYSSADGCLPPPAGADPKTFGCNSPEYFWDVFRTVGTRGGELHLRWTPASNTYAIQAPHTTAPEAPVVTGKQPYFVCGTANKEIVFKKTPCNQNP